jgi:hypothetical protein
MKYCKEHPDYEAKRRPRVECAPCWRLYLEERGTTVEAFASSIMAQDKDLAKWLRTNIDEVIYASLQERGGVETVASKLEFVEPAEVKTFTTPPVIVPVTTGGPAKGTVV